MPLEEQPAHPSALGFRGPGANPLHSLRNAGYQINNNIDFLSVGVEL